MFEGPCLSFNRYLLNFKKVNYRESAVKSLELTNESDSEATFQVRRLNIY